jgi:hypothetical protein
MVRRGRCRCGSILRFPKGPDGFKTVCANCGAVVRLRVEEGKKRASKPPPLLQPLEEPFEDLTGPQPKEQIQVIEMEPWPGPAPPQPAGPLWLLLVLLVLGLLLTGGIATVIWWLVGQQTGES